jgi:hypothetical protein
LAIAYVKKIEQVNIQQILTASGAEILNPLAVAPIA